MSHGTKGSHVLALSRLHTLQCAQTGAGESAGQVLTLEPSLQPHAVRQNQAAAHASAMNEMLL